VGDGRLETLLTAPYSILDGGLFDLYGVARPAGTTGPVRVELDPTRRAGLLTQASFLASHAHENQTSPVARGVTVIRNVLCVALYGHPGVFACVGHEAIERARAEGIDAQMLPGISAEDCLFAELGVDPAVGGRLVGGCLVGGHRPWLPTQSRI
jgi:hypothetical protein